MPAIIAAHMHAIVVPVCATPTPRPNDVTDVITVCHICLCFLAWGRRWWWFVYSSYCCSCSCYYCQKASDEI